MRPLTLKERATEKRALIKALQLRAVELGLLVSHAYAPSSGRNAETRRFDDAMNERKVAERLDLPKSVLRMGRTKWVLFATAKAHENLAKALNRLSARRFDHWTLEFDL